MATCPVCKKPVKDGITSRGKQYHPSCLEHKQELEQKKREQALETDPEEKALVQYILDLFELEKMPSRIAAQMAAFKKQGLTCRGMRLTLHWFYKIENHPVDETSIGIIPYAYKEAEEFWAHMKEVEEANKSFVPMSEVVVVRTRPHRTNHYSKISPYDIGAMEPEGVDTHP